MPIIPKNNEEKNKKVVCTLNDLEKRKVVEHNALIQSVAKMQKSCFLFLKYRLVVSIANSKKPLNLCRNKPISKLGPIKH